MRTTTARMRFAIGLAVLLAGTTACSEIWKTPAPTPTAIPTPDADIPAAILAARSAALDFVQAAYPDKAPPADMMWAARVMTPMGLSGVSYHEFAGDGWLMAINAVTISVEEVLFEVDLDNEEAGFGWSGKLDADYAVVESNLDVSVGVLIARDLVLAHVRERYPSDAPQETIVWMGERTTPMGSVGHESCRFASDEWSMVVQYEVVRPDEASYHAELARYDEAFVWRGRVDPEGTVHELRPTSQ